MKKKLLLILSFVLCLSGCNNKNTNIDNKYISPADIYAANGTATTTEISIIPAEEYMPNLVNTATNMVTQTVINDEDEPAFDENFGIPNETNAVTEADTISEVAETTQHPYEGLFEKIYKDGTYYYWTGCICELTDDAEYNDLIMMYQRDGYYMREHYHYDTNNKLEYAFRDMIPKSDTYLEIYVMCQLSGMSDDEHSYIKYEDEGRTYAEYGVEDYFYRMLIDVETVNANLKTKSSAKSYLKERADIFNEPQFIKID